MVATLRIRFVTTGGFVSAAIRAAQLDWPYSHVDAAIDGGWLGAHAIGGVALRPAGYDAGDATREHIVALTVDTDAAATFRAFLLAQVGKRYDFAAIADFAAGEIAADLRAPGAWREPTRWFCSELVAAALIAAGVFPQGLAADARQVTPRDLDFALSVIADGRP